VVDDETFLRQAELTTTVTAENGFAVASKIPLRAAAPVIARPAPTMGIEFRGSTGSAPPRRLHFLGGSAAEDMYGIEGESSFEGGGQQFPFQPTGVEGCVDRPHPKTAPIDGQLGRIDDIGEFGAVGLVERRH
jgi:hypothetical protein